MIVSLIFALATVVATTNDNVCSNISAKEQHSQIFLDPNLIISNIEVAQWSKDWYKTLDVTKPRK